MSFAFSDAPAARDPLAGFDLESLTRGAARLRPDRLAMSDNGGASLTFAGLDARADAMAARLAAFGLRPGETLMIAGGARVATICAALAGLRAGLDVALAPLHAPAAALAAFASCVGASAIAAPSQYGELNPLDEMFEVAARSPGIRLVCGLGPRPCDGSVDLDADGGEQFAPPVLPAGFSPRLATFAPAGGVAYHGQRALVAAALDLAARARIGMGQPILTTLAPVSFAGLVAGPYLSLLAGAPLRFLGPFAPAEFLDELAAQGPAHVIAPGALCGPLAEGGAIRPDLMATLMLLDRSSEARGALAPLGHTNGVAIIDLHAFGESALIAEPRGPDGRPLPAAREPHMIAFDNANILAVRRREGTGPLIFEGEAVSAAN